MPVPLLSPAQRTAVVGNSAADHWWVDLYYRGSFDIVEEQWRALKLIVAMIINKNLSSVSFTKPK